MFDIDDFLAGWVGGIFGLIVGHPLDTIKVRQQSMGSHLHNAIRRTYKYEGIRGFYKGLLFPLLTIGPSNSLFFGLYGNCMRIFENENKLSHIISPSDGRSIARVFLAGCLAGFIQVIATCPVDLAKTVVQLNTEGKGHWRKHYIPPYSGTIQAFWGIYRERGMKGLYRGCNAMMWRDMPTSGLYVLTYEMLKYSSFAECTSTPLVVKEMIAGGTAGFVSVVSTLPMDLIKTRIQTDNPENPAYRGIKHCIYKSYKNEGLLVFFKGLPVVTIRAFLSHSVLFAMFEFTKLRAEKRNSS